MSETGLTSWSKLHNSMSQGLTQAFHQVEPEKIRMLVTNLVKCKVSGGRVFFAASARSRNIMRTFACRLTMPPISMMAHDLCGSTFPPVKKEDFLIVCSGTGYTQHVVDFVVNWKEMNENVVLITSNDNEKDEQNVLWPIIEKRIFVKGVSDEYKIARRRRRELGTMPSDEDLSETFREGFVDDHFLFEIGSLSLFEAVIHELINIHRLGKVGFAGKHDDSAQCPE